MNTRWNPFVKQLVIIGTLIGTVWVLTRVRGVITPLILALLLAYLVSQPVQWVLRRTGWPRTPVVIVSQIIVVLLILTVPAAITPWLVNALGSFGNTLVTLLQELLEATPKPLTLTPTLTVDLGPYYEPINQWLRSIVGPDLSMIQNLQAWLGPVATSAAGVLRGAVNGVVWLIFIMVVCFYTVRDGPRLLQTVSVTLPEAWRPELSRLWRELVRIWDAFVRGQLILGLIIGVIVWLSMSILGVRNAPGLGLISGLLEFIPAVGPVLAAVPGVAIALFFGSSWLPLPHLWFAVLVGGVYFLIQQLENLYLLPRVVGGRVRLHPAVVIVGALAGAQLGGVLGILLAAPVIAASRLLLGYTFRKLLDQPPFVDQPPAPDRKLVWDELVRARQVRAVLFDLDGTLIESDDRAVEALVQRLRFLGRLASPEQRMRLARRWLMRSEVIVNSTLTLLDRLHLDGPLFRLLDRLHLLRAQRQPDVFVAVAGTPDMLAALRKAQYALGVVTSRNHREAAAFAAQFGLTSLFDVMITRDDVLRLKPHPMAVRKAAEKLGLPVQQCAMVGDTEVDVRAAKTAGALAVGVLCGFGEQGDLGDADLVLDSPAQLDAWL